MIGKQLKKDVDFTNTNFQLVHLESLNMCSQQ